jgi:1-deoxyxylulose-5-phosphate synthase
VRFNDEADRPVVEAVQRVAEARRIPMAHVALAWVLRQRTVTAPIVGPTKPHHLSDAVAALDVTLTDDEVAAVEAPYLTRLPVGLCCATAESSQPHWNLPETLRVKGGL